ncbi:MAG: 23S rRNA (adenine(2503)-C(2))-methyltransferase RlmN [Bacteroidia bacterium]
MQTTLTNIRHLSLVDIKEQLTTQGQQGFRAKQVYEWLWQKSARSFDDMTNLSKDLREWLKLHYEIKAVAVATEQISVDRTIKSGFKLHDNSVVEGVLIPSNTRMTACISSQVGCSLTCKFCATGRMERLRNIDFDEIYDQVAIIKQQCETHYDQPLTNIVYMGMGEPLLNYANVLKSIEKITSPDGLGMSPQRITVSTAGVAKMIKKLGDDGVKFNLALSLHAANDEKRNKIMPINETNSLEALAEALIYFYEKTETRPTYEFIVFKDFNDSLHDAEELYQFTKHVPCKVNIIEYNPIDDAEFEQTTPARLERFSRYLEGKGVIVNVRRSRGKDIDAACGQLANKAVS